MQSPQALHRETQKFLFEWDRRGLKFCLSHTVPPFSRLRHPCDSIVAHRKSASFRLVQFQSGKNSRPRRESFPKFFHNRRRPIHNLSCGNLTNQRIGQYLNFSHGNTLHRRHLAENLPDSPIYWTLECTYTSKYNIFVMHTKLFVNTFAHAKRFHGWIPPGEKLFSVIYCK